MSALRYAQHIFGFETLSSATGSRRLLGRSELIFSQKDPVRQAVVLTVHDVLTLHSKLNDVESGIFDRIGAGYLLLCLYGRCRHSDLANVNHVVHDHATVLLVTSRSSQGAIRLPGGLLRSPPSCQSWFQRSGLTMRTGWRFFNS